MSKNISLIHSTCRCSNIYTVGEIEWPDCQKDATLETCSTNEALIAGFPDILDYIICYNDNGDEMTDINLVNNLPDLNSSSLTATNAMCSIQTVVDTSLSGKITYRTLLVNNELSTNSVLLRHFHGMLHNQLSQQLGFLHRSLRKSHCNCLGLYHNSNVLELVYAVHLCSL